MNSHFMRFHFLLWLIPSFSWSAGVPHRVPQTRCAWAAALFKTTISPDKSNESCSPHLKGIALAILSGSSLTLPMWKTKSQNSKHYQLRFFNIERRVLWPIIFVSRNVDHSWAASNVNPLELKGLSHAAVICSKCDCHCIRRIFSCKLSPAISAVLSHDIH